MTAFELVEPSSLGEALGLLDPDDPAVRPIAGGTALMLMMKTGLYRPRRLVSLRALGRALTGIAATREGGLEIGAMVRLAQIERSAVVRQAAPLVAETLLTHPMSACAMSRPSVAISRTAIRTWICRRC
jgi:aerobic carbon-monoxide dehydrogenase medium subunit